MRILITGSSGQIGTNLALRCLEANHEIIGIDCRPNEWTNVFDTTIEDLSIPATIRWDRPDVVVHLAAHAKVNELVHEPRRALENITMTHNVLEYCRLLAIPIIFSSSREVYGDVYRLSTAETDADFGLSASPYSASKIAGESMVYAYAHCYGLAYIVFRLSNVYGRYDNDLHRMQRVVPLFIRNISQNEPITVFGVEKVIDFTHVDDCIDGIVRGIERLVAGHVRNETINLASGRGYTLLEMAEFVSAAVGKKPKVITAHPLAGEITRYIADLEKAESLLGFSPKITLHEGIRSAVVQRNGLPSPSLQEGDSRA